MRRFLADWINDMNEDGDMDTHTSMHFNFDVAVAVAVKRSKEAGACEWVRVREQVWVGDKKKGYWETVQKWTGDYDQMEVQL